MANLEDEVTGRTRSNVYDEDRGPSSREIRREIERTRSQMDRNLDALEQKLTPSQLALEAWSLFRGGSTAGASRLWRIAKQHPGPAAVIGVGLAWLVTEASKSDDSRRTAKHAVSEAADTTKEAVAGAASTAREAVAGARERVAETTSAARERASELSGQARERVRYQSRLAQMGFWQSMEERPLAIGAAALALGVVAGLLVPSTRKEDELMGETRDRLMERAREVGEEALEKGKQVASVAVDTLKEEAERQDLTPEKLAEKVRNVAKEATNTVKEEGKKQASELKESVVGELAAK